MDRAEIPEWHEVYRYFGSLSEAQWKIQWQTLLQNPWILEPRKQDVLLWLFCEVHFSTRPQFDLLSYDWEAWLPQCSGWIGLGLRYTPQKYKLEEILRLFQKHPNLMGALLFGTRELYQQVVTSHHSTSISFQPTAQQNAFLKRLAADMGAAGTPDPLQVPVTRDMLRKRINRYEDRLAQQCVRRMQEYLSQQPDSASRPATSVALAAPGKRKHVAVPAAPLPLISQQVSVCFLSVIAGLELLKFSLEAPAMGLTPELMTLITSVLGWSQSVAVVNFRILVLAALLLDLLWRGRAPGRAAAE